MDVPLCVDVGREVVSSDGPLVLEHGFRSRAAYTDSETASKGSHSIYNSTDKTEQPQ